MYTKNKKRAGLMLVEVITAIFLIGLMFAMLAVSLDGYASFNDYLLARQRCTAAAEAQLDSIAATGAGLNDETIKRLWPNVKISVEKADGEGQWNGLELVTVNAETRSRRKAVNLRLSRYFLPQQEQ
jgi:hypothetical protein